jgi:putative thioredoxin
MAARQFVSDVTLATFKTDVIDRSNQVPVVIDFWAEWCAPCKTLMPILEHLAEEYDGRFHLARIDTDRERELAARSGIRSLPTVRIVRNGRVVDEFMGALPEGSVRAILDKHVRRPSDDAVEASERLQSENRLAEAIEVLEGAIAAEPGEDRLKLHLAGLLLGTGAIDRAEETFRSLSDSTRLEPKGRAMAARIEFARRAADVEDPVVLEARIANNPDDCAARDHLSVRLFAAGRIEEAMEQLIEIVQRNRRYGDDAGRQGLVRIFEALGNADDRVVRFRRRLSQALN